MRIVDVWKQGTDVLAYCIGEGIDAKFSCKEISTNGNTYRVTAYDVLRSFSGKVSAVLKIGGVEVEDIPHGTFSIVS